MMEQALGLRLVLIPPRATSQKQKTIVLASDRAREGADDTTKEVTGMRVVSGDLVAEAENGKHTSIVSQYL